VVSGGRKFSPFGCEIGVEEEGGENRAIWPVVPLSPIHDVIPSPPGSRSMTQPKSLESLIQHTFSQGELIGLLLHNYLCPFCDSEPAPFSWEFEVFKNSYWGKGLESLQEEELVERDDNPIEDPTLPDPLPSTRFVMSPWILAAAWGLSSRKVLVRSEYHKAEEAALLTNEEGKGVFIVTGQHGIGPPHSPSPYHSQNLTSDQESLCSPFGSSCAVWHSSSPPLSRSMIVTLSFFTNLVFQSSPILMAPSPTTY